MQAFCNADFVYTDFVYTYAMESKSKQAMPCTTLFRTLTLESFMMEGESESFGGELEEDNTKRLFRRTWCGVSLVSRLAGWRSDFLKEANRLRIQQRGTEPMLLWQNKA